jgi:formylglycine-generating enzyme required for sulfatase activity
MGSNKARDKAANKNEMPQHPVLVGDFSLATYPVTVAEYACAVRVEAAHQPPSGERTDWTKQLRSPDRPVIGVSWQDALAYAGWLATLTGQDWRLPTEAEWERAARGPDGRIYPWGDVFDDKLCHNAIGYWTAVPARVGRHPDGASPYGAQDMVGNVWQWTSSQYKRYPYFQDDGRENLQTSYERVLRGGACTENPRFARSTYRKHDMSYYRSNYNVYGFRLACSATGS